MFGSSIALVAWLALAAPSTNPHLAAAEGQVTDLKYNDASKSLAKARTDPGNDRPTLIRILELTGVVEASLGHGPKAVDAFKALLYLDPTHALSDEWGPKVRTPFYEARGWMGDHHPFAAQDAGTESSTGQITAIGITLGEDPLGLMATVRAHVTAGGATDIVNGHASPGSKVVLAVKPAPQLSWWVEVLGRNDEVLGLVGSEQAPLTAGKALAALASVPLATPPPSPVPSAAVTSNAPEAEAPYRPLAYGLMAGGVVGLVVGTICGLSVHSDQSQINSATRDSQGRITSLTQKQAYALNSSAQTDGIIADIGFVAGGVALASGAALWVYGMEMTATPTANGVAVAGAF